MDEDDGLQRAIALSLMEESERSRRSQSRSDNTRRGVTEMCGDGDVEDVEGSDVEVLDEEEAQFQRDLAAAIEASKASSSVPSASSRAISCASAAGQEKNSQGQESGQERTQVERPAFMRDRAQMERERLKRVERQGQKQKQKQKQKRSLERRDESEGKGHDETSGSVSASLVNTNAISPPTKRQRMSPSPPSAQPRTQTNGGASRQNGKARTIAKESNETELFWEGELRQIANRLVDKDKDLRPPFRLSEIIGPKPDITLAILSSYANSVDWLYGFFEPTTPIVVVNQPGEQGNKEVKELAPNMLMTKPFIRNGRGCMHIKLLLLFYKDGRLRVVVPTANLIEYDWRDIENTAWVQDVSTRQTTIRHDPKATDFPATLQRVLHALNVPAALTKFLDGGFPNLPIEALSELRMRWDWSKVQAKLVPSIAGKHDGWDRVDKTGHPALMKAIQELGAQPPKGKQLVLECQGSSIGTYSTQWMNEFYCSACGESAKTWLDRPKTQRSKLPWPPLKILFPSFQTVKNSVLGTPGGGTMFCRKTQWEAKNFPRELFHDSNSKRGRVLMHSKMIVGTFKEKPGMFGTGSQARGDDAERDHTDGEDDGDVLIINASDDEKAKAPDKGKGKGKGKERLVGWAYVGSHNFTPSAWGTLSGSSSNPSINIVNYELGIVLPLKTYDKLEKVACWKRPARKYVEGVDRPWMQEELREGVAIMQD